MRTTDRKQRSSGIGSFAAVACAALFGGSNHYGVPEDKAIAAIADVFMNGILTKGTHTHLPRYGKKR